MTSRTTPFAWAACLLLAAGCAQPPTRASRLPEVNPPPTARSATPLPTLTPEQAAAIWRVTSRLGYGPTPAAVQAIHTHPRGAPGWALDEVDRAFQAVRQAPNVPGELAAFNQPLPQIFAEFRAERDAPPAASQQPGAQRHGAQPAASDGAA